MMRSRSSTTLIVGILAVAGLAGACSIADAPNAPNLSAPASPGASPLLQVTCHADVRALKLACDPAGAQATAGLSFATLGGQGVYVQMINGAPSYDAGTGIFEADVLVQSLIAQPLGTSDGTTPTGVRIFHHSGPTSTAGGGTVTVNNPDGMATFTGPNQPFFRYCTGAGAGTCGPDDILTTNETSDPRRWKWQMSGGATAFTFTVLISARIPHEQSVLRWAAQNSTVTAELNDIWGSSATTYWAVGSAGTIVRTTNGGTSWAAQNSTVTEALLGVWGRSANDVVAVGDRATASPNDARIVITSNAGTSWADQDAGTTRNLRDVWGVSPNVFAAGGSGASPSGRIRISTNNGSGTWASGTTVTEQLNGVWASSSSQAWVVGNAGTILVTTTSGTNWTAQTSPLGAGVNLNAVWGHSATDLWIVGNGGAILRTTNGGTNWTSQTSGTGVDLHDIWGPSAADVFAVGSAGTLLHFDGTSWLPQTSGTGENLKGVFGSSGTDLFVVGGTGTILHGTR